MTGICGWIGASPETSDAARLLADMLGTDAAGDVLTGSSALMPRTAIASRSGIVPAQTYRDGMLGVAVEGRPYWRETEFAVIAVQSGPAAAAAEAYRRHGNQCLQHMSGVFAIAIVDAAAARGVLAVDRMGIRPLYFAKLSGSLVFASTAHGVSAHPKVGRDLSQQAIFNYLYFHMVPSPGTIYRSVRKIQPGECITFDNGSVESQFYWQLQYTDRKRVPMGELEDRFQHLLRDATKRAIGADTSLGAFLSGGTDSSTVTGLLTECRGEPTRTYSMGFAAEGFDETEYARIAARHFGSIPHEYYVTPQDVIEAIPMIAQAYDEPFGNASAVPTFLCARMARADGVGVMFAGDGGDEIFGGNARYAKQQVFEAYWAVPALLRRGMIEPMVRRMPENAEFSPLRKIKSYVTQASLPLPDRLESYNLLTRLPLKQVFESSFLEAINVDEPILMLRDAYLRTASTNALNRMMHLDLKFTLADNDLRKVSRTCEMAGIDVRYPLLDDALVEFSGEIPPALKVRRLQLRYFFKHALRGFLPRETLAKTKHGFGMPFGLWIREDKQLRELAVQSLSAFQARGIVSAPFISQLLRQHETDNATYFGVMIWVLMMLEHWLAARRI